MWMNQSEIEWANTRNHQCPNVRKGLKLLLRLMQAINNQSDGWPYWTAGSKSSENLQKLLHTAGNLNHDTHGEITAAQLRKAITPIRTMVTRQKKIQAKYGNTFDFNVDAALNSIELSDSDLSALSL